MNDFRGKLVWIVGASSGIGKEIAIQLDQLGAILVLSARKEQELKQLNTILSSEKHLVLPLDLADNKDFDVKVKQVVEKFTQIDYLFHSGGISQRAEASESPLAIDRKLMEVNYFGNIALTKAILPYMQAQKKGHLIIISSIAGKFGFYLRSAYAASKHALHGFYESLLLEEEKNGIKVTLVCPGKINTPISLNAITADGSPHGEMDHNQETGMPVQECVKEILAATIKEKKEVLIGNKEILAVSIKRFFPKLFWKIIKKQKAT
jgi:short-subunit dehydrogenase